MYETCLCDDQSEDVENSQVNFIRSNRLLRMFSYCTIDLKRKLFRSYCSSLYCFSLWSDYREIIDRKLIGAINNIHRRTCLLGLPWRCSASAMYANYDLPNIDTEIRRNSLDLSKDYLLVKILFCVPLSSLGLL